MARLLRSLSANATPSRQARPKEAQELSSGPANGHFDHILAYVIVVVPKTWASPRFLAESVPESMISTFSLNLFCTLLSSCRPRVLFTRRRSSSSTTTTTAAAAMAGARLPSHGSHRLGVGGARTQTSICAGRDTLTPGWRSRR